MKNKLIYIVIIIILSFFSFFSFSIYAQFSTEDCFGGPCDDPWHFATYYFSSEDCPCCVIKVYYKWRHCTDDIFELFVTEIEYRDRILQGTCVVDDCKNCREQYGLEAFDHWTFNKLIAEFSGTLLQNGECRADIEASFMPCYDYHYQPGEYGNTCFVTPCIDYDNCCIMIFKVCKNNHGEIDPFPPEFLGFTYPPTSNCPAGCKIFCDVSIPKITINSDKSSNNSINLFEIAPNPSDGILKIKYSLKQKDDVCFIITNINGEIVYKSEFGIVDGFAEKSLNLQLIKSGVYLYKLLSNTNTQVYQSGKIDIVK